MSSNNLKRVIEGFEEDFSDLVQKFLKFSPELELSKFLDFWNIERLDCLFANRYDPRELVEAITHMNESLVDKLTNRGNQDVARILALYFIFCLYLKQPSHVQCKIRLTCNDAISVQEFVDSRQDVAYKNARFVWNQLKAKEIIRFVEDRKIYGPSMLKKQDANTSISDEQFEQSNTDDTREFLNGHISPYIDEVVSMLEKYQELREKLKLDEIEDSAVEIDSSGTFIEFISHARDMLDNFGQSSF